MWSLIIDCVNLLVDGGQKAKKQKTESNIRNNNTFIIISNLTNDQYLNDFL